MHAVAQAHPAPAPRAAAAPRPASAPVLRRACACGGTPGPTGECEACRKKRLQRSASAAAPALAPPIVHDVLRSPGAPLDAGTRAELEPRFGHSFADVRVHADSRAADSARAVGAHAYTVGRDVVFGAGRYAPGSSAGRRLVAHELAHVVQQRGSASSFLQPRLEIGAVDDPAEREADRVAAAVVSGAPGSGVYGAPARRGGGAMLRRAPAEEVSAADQPAEVAAMIEMKTKIDDGRYGCFCGVGKCPEETPINDLDECCQIHDDAYDEPHHITGSKPGPGEISMWSREGFILSRMADWAFVRCAIRSRRDPESMDPAGRVTRGLGVALYSLRAAYATKLKAEAALDSIGR